MGVTQYRSNPNWDDVIQSLLRLGDVSRNNQLGEVRAALAKAEALITKYSLSTHANLLHQMKEKLLRHERGEKVDETHHSQQRSSGASGSRYSHYQEWMRRKAARKAAEKEAKRKTREELRKRRREAKKAERAERKAKLKAAYAPDGKRVRFYMSDRIEWLITYNPRSRGKTRLRFQQVVNAQTVGEFFERGGLKRDLKKFILEGYIKVHKT